MANRDFKLFGRAIILEVFQSMWKSYRNVADGQMDGWTQGSPQGFRPGWANVCLIKFGAIFLHTLVYSLPTLPYVTIAQPAHHCTRVPT